MQFPRKESDILSLAQEMVTGFDIHTEVYPAPLVSSADLTANVEAYHAARGAEMTARAEWEQTVAAYRVERLDPHADETNWEEVGTSTDLEATITKQERGRRFKFRVLAFNRAGTGEASNTVAATL
uniref:Fibronectin type-III domain-containing protein n=1 Tax=Candidatus Kentrum eta TaxID=2126337 RepID=A0A450VLS4_9GAMM|nr:MAG: hypothetical protein BECKH772A_GA0070896_103072 [Candidatus Kentron sp. H]VFK03274.1 MAG: hypothetical protein BECKH772B_GA0070898_103412 [Candidatus Kentron sp. H]VFK05762.1 MAG: hypothetical protein BECKH772C_GA0070978_103002 [Candidatus Kentron sp. H]